jgi:hypothetical protein
MDIEREADKWVRKAGGAKGEYPAYPEAYLNERERRRFGMQLSLKKEIAIEAPSFGLIGASLLKGRDWAKICRHLTPRQTKFVELVREDIPLPVIADLLGCSLSTLYHERERILQVVLSHPLYGLWEILDSLDYHPQPWTRLIYP